MPEDGSLAGELPRPESFQRFGSANQNVVRRASTVLRVIRELPGKQPVFRVPERLGGQPFKGDLTCEPANSPSSGFFSLSAGFTLTFSFELMA
jgi:hypothetical protein